LHRLATSLLFCATLLLDTAAQADALNIQLILSDSSPPYQKFEASFNKALAASNADVIITESQVINDAEADLVITVGMRATESALFKTSKPILAVMVPKVAFENLLSHLSSEKSALSISAIYLDQPWDRQFDLLHATLPNRSKIGLLYSMGTHIDVELLRQNIASRHGSLVAQPVRSADSLYSSLENVLENSDVLLAIPDSAIYSSNNIRNILLTSYRYRIPLIGLSQSYVNAGALCAIFSSPEQLGEQAGSAALFFARSGQLPGSQFPADFIIAVNQQVARSLEIELPSPEVIRNLMNKAKKDRKNK